MAKRKISYRHCPKCGEQKVRWVIQARRFLCDACGAHIARWELREDGQKTSSVSILSNDGRWKELSPVAKQTGGKNMKKEYEQMSHEEKMAEWIRDAYAWLDQNNIKLAAGSFRTAKMHSEDVAWEAAHC